jgi:predicted nuclease of predicted toxin-antitoxin system
MQIKVDEDLPPIVARRLEERGYEAQTVLEQNMGGWKDPQIWQAV